MEHGDDHSSTATSHTNIDHLHLKTGDFNERLTVHQRALKVYQKLHGSNVLHTTLAAKENIGRSIDQVQCLK